MRSQTTRLGPGAAEKRRIRVPLIPTEISMPPVKPNVLSRLILVVDYERMPDTSDIEEVVDKAREVGGPVVGDWYVMAPSKVSVL